MLCNLGDWFFSLRTFSVFNWLLNSLTQCIYWNSIWKKCMIWYMYDRPHQYFWRWIIAQNRTMQETIVAVHTIWTAAIELSVDWIGIDSRNKSIYHFSQRQDPVWHLLALSVTTCYQKSIINRSRNFWDILYECPHFRLLYLCLMNYKIQYCHSSWTKG